MGGALVELLDRPLLHGEGVAPGGGIRSALAAPVEHLWSFGTRSFRRSALPGPALTDRGWSCCGAIGRCAKPGA